MDKQYLTFNGLRCISDGTKTLDNDFVLRILNLQEYQSMLSNHSLLIGINKIPMKIRSVANKIFDDGFSISIKTTFQLSLLLDNIKNLVYSHLIEDIF